MENKAELKFSLDKKLCKSCGICYALCPKGVLAADEDDRPTAVNPEKCIFCMLCEMRCPDYAIRIGRKSNE